MSLRILRLAVFIVIASCSALDGPCPCGGKWLDPRGESIAKGPPSAAAHRRDVHCVCRCGADDEVYMPSFERECRRFERGCTTNDGVSLTWRCQ